jgi:hypothetical protein
LDTSPEEIVDPVASRVFARSPFEYGHDPATPAFEAATLVVTVLQPELALAVRCPPQAAINKPTATSRTGPSVMRRVLLVFIMCSS